MSPVLDENDCLTDDEEVEFFLTDMTDPSGRCWMQDSLTSSASVDSARLNFPSGSSSTFDSLVDASRLAAWESLSVISAVVSLCSLYPSFSCTTFEVWDVMTRLPFSSVTLMLVWLPDPVAGWTTGCDWTCDCSDWNCCGWNCGCGDWYCDGGGDWNWHCGGGDCGNCGGGDWKCGWGGGDWYCGGGGDC